VTNPQTLSLLLVLLAVPACISKEPVAEIHRFRPALTEIELVSEPGTRPLRLVHVTQPAEIGSEMLWRVSETEVVPDATHLWARRPDELLDEQLRDLFFGGGGFRSSYRAGDPALSVQLVRFEGDLFAGATASVELILTLTDSEREEHRGRVHVQEELAERSPQALAEAMGRAMSTAAERARAWLEMRL
jgi:uncharacterized lipoprotein YmbA